MEDDLKKELHKKNALKSVDIADAVIYVLSTPPHVQVCLGLQKTFINSNNVFLGD